jgi:hypothetical protein
MGNRTSLFAAWLTAGDGLDGSLLKAGVGSIICAPDDSSPLIRT